MSIFETIVTVRVSDAVASRKCLIFIIGTTTRSGRNVQKMSKDCAANVTKLSMLITHCMCGVNYAINRLSCIGN